MTTNFMKLYPMWCRNFRPIRMVRSERLIVQILASILTSLISVWVIIIGKRTLQTQPQARLMMHLLISKAGAQPLLIYLMALHLLEALERTGRQPSI